MNVQRLDGRLLNFWVAKSAGLVLGSEDMTSRKRHEPGIGFWHPHSYNPASNWSHAGAIVAAEWFSIEDMLVEWFGPQWAHIPAIADNPCKWFMRAYVATRFGNEVEEFTLTLTMDFANDKLRQPTENPALPPSWLQSLQAFMIRSVKRLRR